MSTRKNVYLLVAGAGIAGCAAAQELQKSNIDYLLLEKNLDPGGLTRSISIGEAHFDYTGHFLHLSQCAGPSALTYAHQADEDWQIITRKSAVLVEGNIIPAPFQYNLYYLPESARHKCIEAFRNRPAVNKIRSFNEYLLAGFGQGIYNYFLRPYNEKIMACSLDDLALDTVKRFFPPPDPQKIEIGYLKEGSNLTTGYNSTFWYPKKYGIGLLAKGLAKDLKAIKTCCPIEKIDLDHKLVYTGLEEIKYEKMLTSLPLKAFCKLTDNSSLHVLSDRLKCTRVYCLNLLIKGLLPKFLQDLHWLYIPGKDIPFYRLGIYSSLSLKLNPPNTTSLYLEIAFLDNTPIPSLSYLTDQVFHSLEELRWLKRSDSLVICAHWIDCAYVHFNHARQEAVDKIKEILNNHRVYPIGRYGLWDYISMEDSILSSIEIAQSISLF